jgi:hypothetical protein
MGVEVVIKPGLRQDRACLGRFVLSAKHTETGEKELRDDTSEEQHRDPPIDGDGPTTRNRRHSHTRSQTTARIPDAIEITTEYISY